MSEETKQLILNIEAGPDADAEEKEMTVRRLREELLQLDIESVDFARTGKVPAKAKASDPITLGTLLLTLAASGGVITTLIGSAQSWLTRNNQRSITLEIDGDKLELKGVSSEEQQKLTNVWLRRHQNVENQDA